DNGDITNEYIRDNVYIDDDIYSSENSENSINDIPTEALIKFVKLLLKEYGDSDHKLFPKSLYK
ncbi:17390_t:CDS:2, partial [Funneliformis geosporum]